MFWPYLTLPAGDQVLAGDGGELFHGAAEDGQGEPDGGAGVCWRAAAGPGLPAENGRKAPRLVWLRGRGSYRNNNNNNISSVQREKHLYPLLGIIVIYLDCIPYIVVISDDLL